MTETVWVLEWAAPPGIPVPPTTAFRTEDGAMAAIAGEARRVGAGPVEEDRSGQLRTIWVGECVAMMRRLELRP